MAADPPIACSLGAAELPARLAEMRAVGRLALRAVEAGDSRAVLRFGAAPGVRARLDAIVAAEARCCSFLTMTLAAEAGDDDALVLTIEAPPEAAPILRELLAAFSPQ
jgi:hypothetical protein